jgi:RNA-directed DNA polymerase
MLFTNITTINQLALLLETTPNLIEKWCVNPIYKSYIIKKKSNGNRHIHMPDDKWIPVLRKINYFLQKIYSHKKLGNDTFSIKKHAKNHINKAHVLSVDIKDFYSSVTAKDIKTIFLLRPFKISEDIATVLALMLSYKGLLPMGSPASAAIANYAFILPDFILSIYAKKHGLSYSRYVDDLTFSSNKFIPNNVISDIESILNEFGFSLNNRKTHFSSKYQSQIVTGLTVNKKVNIPRKYIRNLRVIFYNIETKGVDIAIEEFNKKHKRVKKNITSVEELFKTLLGMVNYIGHIRGHSDSVYNRYKSRLQQLIIRSQAY